MPSSDPEYNRKYYLKNKERYRKKKREWYIRNREKALEYQNEWNRLNRPSKRVAQGRTPTVSGKVRVVLPRKYKRSRDTTPLSGETSLPAGEHDRDVPNVPRSDRPRPRRKADGNNPVDPA